jgi:FkbM family methyltransferase
MRLRSLLFNRFKSLAQELGVCFSWFPPPGSKERLLKNFLIRSRINCVLDVGAFVGQYVLDLRKLGYKGRIFSFEPVPESFAKMNLKLRGDAAWSGQAYGLSDRSRNAMIHTYANGDFNSLLVLKEDAEAAYGLDRTKRARTQIKLHRLDEVLPELLHGINSPRIFLKMDTQGHDVNVLRGTAGVQRWIVGMQSEVPAVPLYEGMLSMSQMLDYYGSCGFVPVGLFPVSTIQSKQISPEFDVIFNTFDGNLAHTAAQGADGAMKRANDSLLQLDGIQK